MSCIAVCAPSVDLTVVPVDSDRRGSRTNFGADWEKWPLSLPSHKSHVSLSLSTEHQEGAAYRKAPRRETSEQLSAAQMTDISCTRTCSVLSFPTPQCRSFFLAFVCSCMMAYASLYCWKNYLGGSVHVLHIKEGVTSPVDGQRDHKLYYNLSCPFEWSKYSCAHQGQADRAMAARGDCGGHQCERRQRQAVAVPRAWKIAC